jgi:phenylalanyl-tRNA synthetase alpha chain
MSTEPLQELELIAAESAAAVRATRTPLELDQQRILWLGRKSRLMGLMKLMGELPPEQKPRFGKRINEVRAAIENALEERRAALNSQPKATGVDISLPGLQPPVGGLHPITQTMHAITAIFVQMGFEIADGPEIEFEYYNFDGLNIPSDHPARDAMDTFFVDYASPQPEKGQLLLRTHTSPVQIRVMEQRKPPIKIIVPGRVYRRDALDPTHSYMFHQVEGLLVAETISFAHLKGVLDQFLKTLFGAQTRTRFRPHFFPFTEPSAEVDIAAGFDAAGASAALARKRWLEIMGCGMVHPNVLRNVGYNPQKVQGFAFGMGVERIAMLKYGVSDIRQFYENDLRFLNQFRTP